MAVTYYAGDDPDIAVDSGESWNGYTDSGATQIFRVSEVGAFDDAPASSNNVRITTTPTLLRAISSIKYKTDVQDMSDEEIDLLYQTRPVLYKSLSTHDNPNHTYYGFIAEEIEKFCPLLAEWNDSDPENLIVDGVQYDRTTVFLVGIVKRQKVQIENLKNKLVELKQKLTTIKSTLN